jgi:hypothetical protein
VRGAPVPAGYTKGACNLARQLERKGKEEGKGKVMWKERKGKGERHGKTGERKKEEKEKEKTKKWRERRRSDFSSIASYSYWWVEQIVS